MGPTYQFSPISFPGRNLFLCHCDVDRIDHNAIALRLSSSFGVPGFCCFCESLVVGRIVSLVKSRGKAKITKLDVTIFIAVCSSIKCSSESNLDPH